MAELRIRNAATTVRFRHLAPALIVQWQNDSLVRNRPEVRFSVLAPESLALQALTVMRGSCKPDNPVRIRSLAPSAIRLMARP